MKNLRNLMAWITISVVLVMGTVSANAGVLLGDRSSDVCTKDDSTTASDVTGIILAGLTGIILAGRDGIILAGRDGIILAGKSDSGCSTQSTGVMSAD